MVMEAVVVGVAASGLLWIGLESRPPLAAPAAPCGECQLPGDTTPPVMTPPAGDWDGIMLVTGDTAVEVDVAPMAPWLCDGEMITMPLGVDA